MPCDYGTAYESHKRIRPEFLKSYSQTLNADALLDLDEEGHQDDLDVKSALMHMRGERMAELVEIVNNFDAGMQFHGDVSILFHEHGIPLRYMGHVCDQVTNVFARHSLEIEMAVRSLKKIYRNTQTEYFFA